MAVTQEILEDLLKKIMLNKKNKYHGKESIIPSTGRSI